MHHRFKLILNYSNVFTLFTFFKFFYLYKQLPEEWHTSLLVWRIFYAPLFFNTTFFFEFLFSISSRLHLTTKFHRTVHIYALQSIRQLLRGQHFVNIPLVTPGLSLFTTAYFYPFQVLFPELLKKFYKPLFIFFMLISALQWPVLNYKYFFSNVFFFIPLSFTLIYFVNRKVFRTQYI